MSVAAMAASLRDRDLVETAHGVARGIHALHGRALVPIDRETAIAIEVRPNHLREIFRHSQRHRLAEAISAIVNLATNAGRNNF